MNASTEDCRKEYMEEMEKVEKVSSIEGEQLVVCSYVNTTLWKKIKFVAPFCELDYDEQLCQRVLDDLNVGIHDRMEFWIRIGNQA
jgi:hypothetical protein